MIYTFLCYFSCLIFPMEIYIIYAYFNRDIVTYLYSVLLTWQYSFDSFFMLALFHHVNFNSYNVQLHRCTWFTYDIPCCIFRLFSTLVITNNTTIITHVITSLNHFCIKWYTCLKDISDGCILIKSAIYVCHRKWWIGQIGRISYTYSNTIASLGGFKTTLRFNNSLEGLRTQ